MGLEAFLTSHLTQAMAVGFRHDDIPDERRADIVQSATERLLTRFPQLAGMRI